MRLLVVSSSKVFPRTVANALRGQRHVIEEANSGLRGLHVGAGQAFDMVLLDSDLHDVPGLEFVSQYRALADPDVPFLYFATKGTYRDVLGAFDLGVDDYILLPFDASNLLRKLDKQARRHRDRIRRRRLALAEPAPVAPETMQAFVSVPEATPIDAELSDLVEQSKPRKYVRKDAFKL
jgi:DNA-binding response OmpR family regulator